MGDQTTSRESSLVGCQLEFCKKANQNSHSKLGKLDFHRSLGSRFPPREETAVVSVGLFPQFPEQRLVNEPIQTMNSHSILLVLPEPGALEKFLTLGIQRNYKHCEPSLWTYPLNMTGFPGFFAMEFSPSLLVLKPVFQECLYVSVHL